MQTENTMMTPTIMNSNLSYATYTGTTDSSSNAINLFQVKDCFREIEKEEEENMSMLKKRIVQVFICDADEDVPIGDCLLYKGEQKLTDLTDQELYFEIGINSILKEHNEQRVEWIDKKATKKFGKEIFLETIKIRDLKMVVCEIARFQ